MLERGSISRGAVLILSPAHRRGDRPAGRGVGLSSWRAPRCWLPERSTRLTAPSDGADDPVVFA